VEVVPDGVDGVGPLLDLAVGLADTGDDLVGLGFQLADDAGDVVGRLL
jgi:hypothetical protein